ncbi:MAG: hypothetical protein H6760_02800 [Candidatus Nomurabacteria bacterium]|nr:MAG: hypothetical protein H6760_02800 [Candidatus Nomurabacteria bacterium]
MRASTLIILILFLATLAFGGVYFFSSSKSVSEDNTNSSPHSTNTAGQLNVNIETTELSAVPPEPSDDIDSIANALASDAQVEETTTLKTDDAALLSEDEQALTDLGQAYTESDLP